MREPVPATVGSAAGRRTTRPDPTRDRRRTADYPVDDPHSSVDWSDGGTVLAFVNEVAGGRKLLEAIRERVEAGADASPSWRRRTSRSSARSSTATRSATPP